MARLTDKDLFEFVYRADTPQKIATAERWLSEHKHLSDFCCGQSLNVINRCKRSKQLIRSGTCLFDLGCIG